MRQSELPLPDELIVDNFAGGGGASIGIEAGIGRTVDVAINHDAEAIAMHRANHPGTRHYTEDVWKIDPVRVTRNRPVGLAWFSPDCKHFSKAKGRRPVSKKIRGLAWVVVRWARRVRPRVIMLENVEEFQDWGPVSEDGIPCPDRKGQTFEQFVGQLERYGYRVEWRQLRACDYGAPTIRKRLFLVARRDGLPIRWPEPTHGEPGCDAVNAGELLPWRSAAECIDWSIPCPSIFTRTRPLAENTMRRIARGIQRFVLDDPEPFIVRIGQTGWGGDGMQYRVTDPLTTVTSKAEHCLAMPAISTYYGAKDQADGRGARIDEPLRTQGTANRHALVAAFMAQHNGGFYDKSGCAGRDAQAPTSTITGRGTQQQVVAAYLLSQHGTDQRHRPATVPASTICAGGNHAGLVAAFLATYYGNDSIIDTRSPAHTVTSKDRLQLITVSIDGTDYVLADIGMRMLQPHELFAAQGFPADYIHDHGLDADGERVKLTKTAQVRMCGNSVCPPLATALVRANFQHEAAWRSKDAA